MDGRSLPVAALTRLTTPGETLIACVFVAVALWLTGALVVGVILRAWRDDARGKADVIRHLALYNLGREAGEDGDRPTRMRAVDALREPDWPAAGRVKSSVRTPGNGTRAEQEQRDMRAQAEAWADAVGHDPLKERGGVVMKGRV